MVLVTVVVAALCVFSVAWWWRARTRRPPGLRRPPGPYGVPLLGYLPFLGRLPHTSLTSLRDQYGDVVEVNFGSKPVLVLNSRSAIRAALLGQPAAFAGRPHIIFGEEASGGNSFTCSSYTATYRAHRRLVAAALRQRLRGSDQELCELVTRTADSLVDRLTRDSDTSLDPVPDIQEAVADFTFGLLFGAHCSVSTDSACAQIFSIFRRLTSLIGGVQLADFLPWTRPFLARPIQALHRAARTLDAVARSKAEDAARDTGRGCLAGILSDMADSQSGVKSGVGRGAVLSSVEDVAGGGFETGSTLLAWYLLYMAHHQHVQRRVHRELDAVDGPVLSTDLAPYTAASVLEVARHAALNPFGLPHATTRDVTLHDYVIKAGTMVLVNLHAYNTDRATWTDPDVFRPDRFLTTDGTRLDPAAVDQLCLFGLGPRRCVGERVARTYVMLLVIHVIRQLDVSPCPRHPSSLSSSSVDVVHRPAPYRLLMTPHTA